MSSAASAAGIDISDAHLQVVTPSRMVDRGVLSSALAQLAGREVWLWA